MAARTLRCMIEEVPEWYPRLFLEPYIVACVALISQYSRSPASFAVECEGIDSRWLAGDEQFRLQVSWTEATAEKAERLRATMPATEVVELAAVALALILARRVLGVRRLVVTSRGERADYRAPSLSRVLVDRRHREKVAQALRNPFTWDAYVIVCGFAAPASVSPPIRGRRPIMPKTKARPYPQALQERMAEISGNIMKARALVAMGMPDLAQAAWLAAAAGEEQTAPHLDALDRDQEAAVHRLSAASCYQHAGEWAKAINLYRAALAGPLPEDARKETEKFLADCLNQFTRSANGNGATRRR